MPKQRVYYDYVNGELVPYWYVLTFKNIEISWDKSGFFFDAIAPFQYFNRDQFDDSILSTSIYMTDLIFNEKCPERIGINLKRVRQRISKFNVCPSEIRQFIIPIPDIDEFLKLLPNRKSKSFMINNS